MGFSIVNHLFWCTTMAVLPGTFERCRTDAPRKPLAGCIAISGQSRGHERYLIYIWYSYAYICTVCIYVYHILHSAWCFVIIVRIYIYVCIHTYDYICTYIQNMTIKYCLFDDNTHMSCCLCIYIYY